MEVCDKKRWSISWRPCVHRDGAFVDDYGCFCIVPERGGHYALLDGDAVAMYGSLRRCQAAAERLLNEPEQHGA